jgi:hypothetical protein
VLHRYRPRPASLSWLEDALVRHRAVVFGMNATRLEDCPSDFQSAYVDHTQAWTDKMDALARLKVSTMQLALLAEQTNGMMCCLQYPRAQQVLSEVQSSIAAENTSVIAIRNTWIEVRKASPRYGVEPYDFEAAAFGGIAREQDTMRTCPTMFTTSVHSHDGCSTSPRAGRLSDLADRAVAISRRHL